MEWALPRFLKHSNVRPGSRMRPAVLFPKNLLQLLLLLLVGMKAGASSRALRKTTDATQPVIAGESSGVEIKDGERILLTVHVRAFQGSSALEALLLTSPQLTTLCDMAFEGKPIWQCEPGKAYVDVDTLQILGDGKMDKEGRRPNRTQAGNLLPIEKRLQFYSQYWNLERPVLFCKFCALSLGVTCRSCNQKSHSEIKHALSHPPVSYRSYGISTLKPMEIVLWRPLCLCHLSRHDGPAQAKKVGWGAYLATQIDELADHVCRIQENRANGVPQLVIGLHELVWRPAAASRRILAFVPHLSALNFTGDHHGLKSKLNFGDSHPPDKCCSFDLRTSSCSFTTAEFSSLSSEQLHRAREVSEFLLNESTMFR